MPLPTNTTIHLPFLIPNNGGYNLFVDGLHISATVVGLPPSAMVAGLPDLIVGIPSDDETTTNAGRVYVVFGNPTTAPNTLLVSNVGRLITIDGARR